MTIEAQAFEQMKSAVLLYFPEQTYTIAELMLNPRYDFYWRWANEL